MLFSTWIYPKQNPQESRRIQREQHIPAIVADILAARNLQPYQLADLLGEGGELIDPFRLPDMEKAVNRLEEAIATGERIAIYGDYDCDGITATVILYTYLQSMGADVIYYIPDRLDEGYGMNMDALEQLARQQVRLIVTVDNGITAVAEAERAAQLGMDLIITDHHQVGSQLPRAVALVNPHRPEYREDFRGLCGAGVAFKLVIAMEGGDADSVMESFGALAAMATIGDVVPLAAENRFLVQEGLARMADTDNLGLRCLLEVSGLLDKPLTAQRVAFGLVPRINAAGRMGHADLAVRLLLAEGEETARQLAEELDELNRQRREQEEEILHQMVAQLEADPEKLLDRVLVLSGTGMNHGVVGIVSSRLVSLYGKPNFVISVEDGVGVGSARSVGDFSLFQALCHCAPLLDKFGGHTLAAGVTLGANRLPAFSQAINGYAAQHHDRMPRETISIDRVLKGGELSVAAVEALELLEPFGEGNPQPVFLMPGCEILQLIPLSGGKHLKVRVRFEGQEINILCFRMTPEQFAYPVGSTADILVNLEISSYRGNKSISVRMKEMRPTWYDAKKMENADYYYQKIRRGEAVDGKIMAIAVPTLAELRQLYKLLRSREGSPFHLDLFYLMAVQAGGMNYCKYRLSMDILQEMQLIRIEPDFSSVSMLPVTGKVQMEQSVILSRLCQQKGE